MTQAFRAAMEPIEEQLTYWREKDAAEARAGNARSSAMQAEILADLERQVEVYRFLVDTQAVTDEAERYRLLDALYVHTRKRVVSEPHLVLGSGDLLPTDPFEIARFMHFSVPQWWQDASGDATSDLYEVEAGADTGLRWSVRDFPAIVVSLEAGTFVQREEHFFQHARYQLFRVRGQGDGPEEYLRLVLRQWVEEPGEGIASALQDNPEWQRLVARPEVYYSEEDAPDYQTQCALRKAGLPATPSVQRYLKYEGAKRHEPDFRDHYPTSSPVVPYRGGMVNTFVLVRGDGKKQSVRTLTTLNPCAWATGDFYEYAGRCAHAHGKWVQERQFGDLFVPALRGRRRTQDAINRDFDREVPLDQAIANEVGRLESASGMALKPEERRLAVKRVRQRYWVRKKAGE